MKPKLWIAFALILHTGMDCRAALEFSAYLRAGKESKFVVTGFESNSASGWIAIGESFEGHVLVAFDPKKEVLSVRKGDATFELPLKSARVREASVDTNKMKKQILKNLRLLSSTAERYFLEKGVSEVPAAEAMRHFGVSIPPSVDGEDYATLIFRQAVVVTIKTRSGIEVDYPEDWKILGWRK